MKAMARVCLTLAIALTLGAVSTPRAFAQVGDSVVGAGTADTVPFDIDAHSGPSGENPTGQVLFIIAGETYAGPVTCLRVVGRDATIGSVTDRDTFNGPAGTPFIVHVSDRTPGSVDLLRVHFYGGSGPPTSCPDPELRNPTAVTSGDVAVVDVAPPPVPTTEDECKNGGWRNYPHLGFKNQGECIQYVKDKPPKR